jgi:hypothetical protein
MKRLKPRLGHSTQDDLVDRLARDMPLAFFMAQ